MNDYNIEYKKEEKKIKQKDNNKKEKPFDFIINTLKILQNKNDIPDDFTKKELYKYPF